MNDEYDAAVYCSGVHVPRIGAFFSGFFLLWVLMMFATTAMIFPGKVGLLLGLTRMMVALPFAWYTYVTVDPLLFVTERLDMFWKKAYRLTKHNRTTRFRKAE
uniref:Uncharacterized protein n=1 Tax=Lotharella globosa TaxID=91324 RepID=A0A7S3YEF4_9EUKA